MDHQSTRPGQFSGLFFRKMILEYLGHFHNENARPQTRMALPKWGGENNFATRNEIKTVFLYCQN